MCQVASVQYSNIHTHTHTHTLVHMHVHMHTSAQPKPVLHTGQPTVKLLTCFPSVVDGEKRTINIIQRTGTSFEKLGMFLLEDDNGDIIDSLKEACHHDPIQITTAVYKKWISGTGRKPVTWQTLVDVLREIDLNRVADDIDSTVKAPK